MPQAGAAPTVTPLWRTADWGYLRFHEGDGAPWPRYRESSLQSWADRIAAKACDLHLVSGRG